MPTKVETLVARRAQLVLQAERQRNLLAHEFQQLDRPLYVADTVLNLANFFKRQPWLITIGSALVGAFGLPKWNVPSKVSSVWNFAKGAVNFWQKLKFF